MITLFNGDCIEVMRSAEYKKALDGKKAIIVTDPPFNIGYHYGSYKDNLKESAYFDMMGGGINGLSFCTGSLL